MRLTSVVIMSTALLLSSTAMAKDKKLASNEQASAPTAYQAPEAAAPGEKQICKSLKVTGTRMFKKTCLTQKQWDEVDEESK